MLPDAPLGAAARTVRHQRAHGALDLRFVAGARGTALADLRQEAPLRALFPRPEPDEAPVVAVVNVAGGLAGGDTHDIAVSLGAGARATLSSAAAEKVHRSLGAASRIAVRLEAGPAATLEWIPQETILFDRARLERRMTVEAAADARVMLGDMLVFGRAAHGEGFTGGTVNDAWRVRRGGTLAWADGLRLDGDLSALRHRFGFGGAGAAATLLLLAPGADAEVAGLRDALAGAPGGVTAPRAGLLVARFVGDAGAVRGTLAAAIVRLRARCLGLPPWLPRLWTT